jgi:hypothetical protein
VAEAIAAFVRLHAPHVARIGLETGATSTWLWTELNNIERGVADPKASTLRAIQSALEAAGVEFTDGSGIKPRRI